MRRGGRVGEQGRGISDSHSLALPGSCLVGNGIWTFSGSSNYWLFNFRVSNIPLRYVGNYSIEQGSGSVLNT